MIFSGSRLECEMKDFKDKVTFITGGANGVGLGQAQVMARWCHWQRSNPREKKRLHD